MNWCPDELFGQDFVQLYRFLDILIGINTNVWCILVFLDTTKIKCKQWTKTLAFLATRPFFEVQLVDFCI